MTPRKRLTRKPRDRVVTKRDASLKALQRLSEADLTRKLVMPLFASLDFDKVEYFGGQSERGRDLICTRTRLLGGVEIAVVQLKKYRFTAKASDPKSLGEVVTQLSQAFEEPIPTLDGRQVNAREVFFITPYAVDTRALESRFQRFASLRDKGAQIIDGPQLLSLLRKHRSDLLRHLGDPGINWSAQYDRGINNDPLTNALHFGASRSTESFHTDIDFSVGSAELRQFLRAPLVGQDYEVLITPENSNDVFSCLTFLCNLSPSCLDVDIAEIQHTFEPLTTAYKHALLQRSSIQRQSDLAANRLKQIEDDCRTVQRQVAEALAHYQREHHRLAAEVADATAILKVKEQELDRDTQNHRVLTRELEDIRLVLTSNRQKLKACERYKSLDSGVFAEFIRRAYAFRSLSGGVVDNSDDLYSAWQVYQQANEDTLAACAEAATSYGSDSFIPAFWHLTVMQSVKESVDNIRRKEAEAAAIVDDITPPTTRVIVRGAAIAKSLEAKRRGIIDSLRNFKKSPPPINELATLLSALHDINAIVRGIRFFQAVLYDESHAEGSVAEVVSLCRLSIPVQQVVATGRNVLLVGEAGSGKTTSLQMFYCDRVKRMGPDACCMFLELGRVAAIWKELGVSVEDGKAPPLERVIAAYMRSQKFEFDDDAFIETLKTRAITLLLDGLDEAIRTAPWMPSSISLLIDRFPLVHVVVSSRSVGSFANGLALLPVGLMPFTKSQQRAFFAAWFQNDSSRASRIAIHLDGHPMVQEVTTNPLLATILCRLAESEIPLPQTEPQIYAERMRLLTGAYDVHKGIQSRQRCRSDDLIGLAQYIAYRLHNNSVRDVTYEQAKQMAIDYGHRAMCGSDAACKMLEELIDPCTIVVPSENGKLCFGHLRFQEYLVARRINADRTVEIEGLFSSEWWRDVLVMAARMSDNLLGLCQWTAVAGGRPAQATIRAMIATAPATRQRELRANILPMIGLRAD